ncbi:MAG: Mur ligase family protein [Rhodothermia bacterium]|nr:MAG: Mur ligase family protein [Rhodothermia bacterium]
MPRTPAEKFLLKLPRFALVGNDAYQPGLTRISNLLGKVGNPQHAFPSIHIAGTNGKGSTASMIAAIATSSGLKTGLHTSPHLIELSERMRVNGVPAPAEWLSSTVDRIADETPRMDASFFEATFALSLLYFQKMEVDLAVVEVGLGGRLDATNILMPLLSVITQIGLDHQEILGDTVEKISMEKAGIIKPETPVLTSVSDESVLACIQDVATERSAPLHTLREEVDIQPGTDGSLTLNTPIGVYENLYLELRGAHQQPNAALAVRAIELIPNLVEISKDSVNDGLGRVSSLSGIRARNELIWSEPLIVADVAHNSEAMLATLSAVEDEHGPVDHVFMGLMLDKDVSDFARVLGSKKIPVSTLVVDSERAFDPEMLGSILQGLGARFVGSEMDVFIALDEYVQSASSDAKALVLGSHLVAAEALKWADALKSGS